jgi:hypothetical protein
MTDQNARHSFACERAAGARLTRLRGSTSAANFGNGILAATKAHKSLACSIKLALGLELFPF